MRSENEEEEEEKFKTNVIENFCASAKLRNKFKLNKNILKLFFSRINLNRINEDSIQIEIICICCVCFHNGFSDSVGLCAMCEFGRHDVLSAETKRKNNWIKSMLTIRENFSNLLLCACERCRCVSKNECVLPLTTNESEYQKTHTQLRLKWFEQSKS